MDAEMHRQKYKPSTIVTGHDGRQRVFTDGGVCLGLVVPEDNVDITPDAIAGCRGVVTAIVILAVQAMIVWCSFKLGTRWK